MVLAIRCCTRFTGLPRAEHCAAAILEHFRGLDIESHFFTHLKVVDSYLEGEYHGTHDTAPTSQHPRHSTHVTAHIDIPAHPVAHPITHSPMPSTTHPITHACMSHPIHRFLRRLPHHHHHQPTPALPCAGNQHAQALRYCDFIAAAVDKPVLWYKKAVALAGQGKCEASLVLLRKLLEVIPLRWNCAVTVTVL